MNEKMEKEMPTCTHAQTNPICRPQLNGPAAPWRVPIKRKWIRNEELTERRNKRHKKKVIKYIDVSRDHFSSSRPINCFSNTHGRACGATKKNQCGWIEPGGLSLSKPTHPGKQAFSRLGSEQRRKIEPPREQRTRGERSVRETSKSEKKFAHAKCPVSSQIENAQACGHCLTDITTQTTNEVGKRKEQIIQMKNRKTSWHAHNTTSKHARTLYSSSVYFIPVNMK